MLIAFSPRLAGAADELYSARAVVTGRSEANRALGFAICLSNVLVKVSGDPTIEQMPDLSRLQSKAADLVTGFNYRDLLEGIPMHDEQGSYDRPQYLTVSFDPSKVDAALLSLHRMPWRGQRPTVALALAVNGRKGNFVLTVEEDASDSAAMREAFAAASAKFGIPVDIPARSEMAARGLDARTIPTADAALLAQLASANHRDIGLAGTLDWSDKALGWVAHWRLSQKGQIVDWTVKGVNFDEAFRNAVRGVAQIASGNGNPH